MLVQKIYSCGGLLTRDQICSRKTPNLQIREAKAELKPRLTYRQVSPKAGRLVSGLLSSFWVPPDRSQRSIHGGGSVGKHVGNYVPESKILHAYLIVFSIRGKKQKREYSSMNPLCSNPTLLVCKKMFPGYPPPKKMFYINQCFYAS